MPDSNADRITCHMPDKNTGREQCSMLDKNTAREQCHVPEKNTAREQCHIPDIILLDCTLRDGGYVNDWEFGHDNLMQIYARLCDAGVDAIELGFLDDRRPADDNRSIFPDTGTVRRIWGLSGKRPPMLAGMIDYGTCSIKNLEPAEDSFLDTIRVIFKEHLMKEAMDFCAQVKALGYRVCAQLVSVTSYTDELLLQLVRLVNGVKPFAVSIVDTYGLLNPKKLLHIDRILDAHVADGVRIGFHAHNNLQLAFANCIAFLETEHRHGLLLDGTLYGMGKSAGNAPLELAAMYLNEYFGKSYRIAPMLESIEESIADFYAKNPWGYQMPFYLSAKNACHPGYVNDYQKTGNLSMTDLDKALSAILPEEKKLLYNKEASAFNYAGFLQNSPETQTLKALQKELSGKEILIIGPGRNIRLQEEKVLGFIRRKQPGIISINYLPEHLPVQYVFASNRRRLRQMSASLQKPENRNVTVIAASSVQCLDGIRSLSVNREPLLEHGERIADNSLLMLLQVLRRAGVHRAALAGFDGYSSKEGNYLNPDMEYGFLKDNAARLNRHVRDALRTSFADMDLSFITYSHYEDEEDSSLAAF